MRLLILFFLVAISATSLGYLGCSIALKETKGYYEASLDIGLFMVFISSMVLLAIL